MDSEGVNNIPQAPVTQTVPEAAVSIPVVEQKPIQRIATDNSIFQEIPPKPKSKILPLLIIVLALAVLGFVAYWLYKNNNLSTQTPATTLQQEAVPTSVVTEYPATVVTKDPTADWTTLSNKNGFSIKYPPNYKALGGGMDVDEFNDPDVIIAINPGHQDDTSAALHINVAQKAYTVYKDMTLAEISKANYEANQANENTFQRIVKPIETTILDEKLAYTYTIEANGYSGKWSGWPLNASLANPQILTVIESENNGNYFIILYSSEDQVIESVLSTFKFVE